MNRRVTSRPPGGSQTKEDKLKATFGEVGQITDCSLKFTREGVFRKFAFIGFKSESEADAAVKRFNKSFINTSRLQVEIAKDLADSEKPRAWSRHTPGTTAYREDEELKAAKTKSKSKHAKKKTLSPKKEHVVPENKYELLGELKDDPGFEEFVVAHKNRASKAAWGNDIEVPGEAKVKCQGTSDASQKEDIDDSDDENHSEKESQVKDTAKVSTTEDISDIDYIKSKMTKNKFLTDDDDDNNDSDDDDNNDSDDDELEENKDVEKTGKNKEKTDGKKENSSAVEEGKTFHYVVNMRGLPGNATQKQILEFFKPIKPKQVKVPKRHKGTAPATTVATVQFSSETDWEMAMRRNKNFIGWY
ncbi:hypothetical protein NP493_953g00018 [Ridgeia piscesae]|uniref:RRM domain-containing protein n=1 Tax=Ridgeia piscesae TaxID=27915 RepID=A0AAD9NJP4_RIDPI|nr:hypothetical protein NP493_953g00018 [Ridgeia piscesae]